MDAKPSTFPALRTRKAPVLPESLSDPKALAMAIVEAAWSKNGYHTRIYDVRKLVDYTDLFVILTGRSDRQVTAIAEAIEVTLKSKGAQASGIEGKKSSTWVLIDYGSVVVHVFEKTARDHYDLDKLWADAEVVEVVEPTWVQEFSRVENGEDW
jgi:ribosome-associated protein